MIPLYSKEEFELSKSSDKLSCKCENCNKTFYNTKKEITRVLQGKKPNGVKYCSRNCVAIAYNNKRIQLKCTNCNEKFNRIPSIIKENVNQFCSRSCSTTFNNKNKTHGTTRSKLEIWIEQELKKIYKMDIHFNQKDTIGSELDIYIPELKIAIELNGIFHYKPIFGEKKLNKIQENDKNKIKNCLKYEIDLFHIDTSSMNCFNTKQAEQYLIIINKLIKKRINKSQPFCGKR